MIKGDERKLKFKMGEIVRLVQKRFSHNDYSGSVPNSWLGQLFKVTWRSYDISEFSVNHEWRNYKIEPLFPDLIMYSKDKTITYNSGRRILDQTHLISPHIVYEKQLAKVKIQLKDITYFGGR